jgi:hypothetical protein
VGAEARESCPRCGEPRIGPFCERCGHLYSAGSVPDAAAPSSWYAVVAPDRRYFESGGLDTERFTFPADAAARRVELTGPVVRIGRRSGSRGTTPAIDLADPPADPGVSREHARLLARPDGTWAVVDDGSTNGTYLNGGTERLRGDQPVPLADGDRVHLGVWTTITLRAGS